MTVAIGIAIAYTLITTVVCLVFRGLSQRDSEIIGMMGEDMRLARTVRYQKTGS